jgi:hypothetical protein
MFGDIALVLLRLMGNSGKVPGALMPEDIPEALANLKAAVAANPERPLNPRPLNSTQDTGRGAEGASVSLAHRAMPLIHLLETALARSEHVIWE